METCLILSGNAMLSKTVMWGHIAYDWKTIPTFRFSGGTFVSCEKTVASSIDITPLSGFSRPAMHLSVVVFPHPLGPNSVVSVPFSKSIVISSTATMSP